jgi:hypothetical protein
VGLEVERPSVFIPVSAEQLEDATFDVWTQIQQGFEAARRDAEWLAAMRPAQRFRVLRLRALIRRTIEDEREREREDRTCPCCGHDPYECGDVAW